MGADEFLGWSRDQQNGLLFLLGLVFVVVGAVFAGDVGGHDVLVRMAGYVMVVYSGSEAKAHGFSPVSYP